MDNKPHQRNLKINRTEHHVEKYYEGIEDTNTMRDMKELLLLSKATNLYKQNCSITSPAQSTLSNTELDYSDLQPSNEQPKMMKTKQPSYMLEM